MYRASTISHRPTRCEDGHLWRPDPQDDDPYLETNMGVCPECDGKGCVTCPRCKQVMGDADGAEGCEDLQCPLIGGVTS